MRLCSARLICWYDIQPDLSAPSTIVMVSAGSSSVVSPYTEPTRGSLSRICGGNKNGAFQKCSGNNTDLVWPGLKAEDEEVAVEAWKSGGAF